MVYARPVSLAGMLNWVGVTPNAATMLRSIQQNKNPSPDGDPTCAVPKRLLGDGLNLVRLGPLALQSVFHRVVCILRPKYERHALLCTAAGHLGNPKRPINRRLHSFRSVLDIGVA